MAKPALIALGAVLLAGGAGLAGFGATRKPTGGMTPKQSEAMGSAIAQLDGDVKTAQAVVRERATTLATIPMTQAAVATDVTTAADMLKEGELSYLPKAGEAVEVGRIVKATNATEVLLIQPPDAKKNAHGATVGSYADLMGDKALIVEVASVTPKYPTEDFSGFYVAVSRPLDLKPSIERLTAAGVTGVLDVEGQKMMIGTPPAKAETRETALQSLPKVKLVASVPAKTGGPNMALAGAGGAGAVAGLILLVLGLVGGKKSVPATQAAQPQTGTTGLGGIGTAQTQMSSGGYAAGTPSPVGVSGDSSISPTNLGPGAMIGRWEIIKRLGSGGMADVYLARAKGEAGFEKTVAVKVMHPHLARNTRAVDHFLDEARLAVSITHPNVVAIQDLGKIGNDYVIVMEYVDGVDLDRLLGAARNGNRPVPVEVALGILCRICDGLNAAHTALAKDGSPLNIIHRDVKAANVLVSRQGGVKVVDFGIAKAAQQGHNTVAGETKGTPSMMAPEQRVGEVVDVRADVYSTAAVAFEVLTGHAVNLDLAALAHLGVDNWPHLPLLTSLRPQLPVELDGLVLGAMAFERDKRPASCAALEASFEAIMKKHGLTCSDKDIARWVTGELQIMQSQAGHESTALATPA